MWRIVINGPGYFDTPYDLPQGVTSLGRADENDIVLSGDLVSRRHARLEFRDGRLFFEDLGSRNGSKMGETPITGTRELEFGDIVHVGENVLTVRQREGVDAPSTMLHVASTGEVRIGEPDELGAVLLSKDMRDSALFRLLDNVTPFDLGTGAPTAASPSATPVAYDSLMLLYGVTESLVTATSLSGFLEPVVDRLLARANATTAVVLLRQETGPMVAATVRHRGQLAAGEIPVSDAIVREALTKRTALAVADVRGDRRFASRESVVTYGVDQALCVPFGPGRVPLGVLYLNRTGTGDEGLSELLDLCGAVGHLIGAGVGRFAKETRNESAFRRTLERFHSNATVQRMVDALAGQPPVPALSEKQVTALYADVSGFAALLGAVTPDVLTQLMGELYRTMSNIVFAHDGTLAALAGDAVLAVFGSPESRPDDAARALRAALQMRAEWDAVLGRFPAAERRRLHIGLHSGKVVSGLVGVGTRFEHVSVGEAVDVAMWLAGTAEPGQVLVTGKTLAQAGSRFDVLPLGDRNLRGRSERVAAFEVLDESPAPSGSRSGA